MDFLTSWNNKEWKQREFSYHTETLLAQVNAQSRSDVQKLIRQCRKTLILSVVLLIVTPFALLLKPGNAEFTLMVGLISAYSLVLCAFLSWKFTRFRLPDMSTRPVEAIDATLKLVRSINAFQINLLIFSAPVIFLSSLLGTLILQGRSLPVIFGTPVIVLTIIGSTAGISLLMRPLRKYLSSKQCQATLMRLEATRKTLEEVD
jgi:hypothetical protein